MIVYATLYEVAWNYLHKVANNAVKLKRGNAWLRLTRCDEVVGVEYMII